MEIGAAFHRPLAVGAPRTAASRLQDPPVPDAETPTDDGERDGGPSSSPVAAAARQMAGWARGRWLLFRRPELRRLRWVLGASLLVQLLLAPLTSWGFDTPGFTQGVVGLVYRGNPYSSNFFFNPPLAPFVQSPFFLGLARFLPVGSWIRPDRALYGAESGTGMVSALLPDPWVLLCLKLPLILAATAVGIVLFRLLRRAGVRVAGATAGSAAWLLNPLVIWATAVHGEVDVLASLCAALAIFGIIDRWPTPAVGLFVGLGFFAKIYPLLLIPPLAAALYARRRPEPRTVVALDLLGLGAGVGMAALPFYGIWGAFSSAFFQGPGTQPPLYGGLNLLLLFNHHNLDLGPGWARVLTPGLAAMLDAGYLVLAGLAVAGATLLLLRSRAAAPVPDETRRIALAWLWVSVGALLLVPNPQPENLLGLLPALLLLGPGVSRLPYRAFLLLSAAGLGLYLSFATPLAYFLPAVRLLGDPNSGAVVAIIVDYFREAPLRLGLWNLFGLVGGATILVLWAFALDSSLTPARRAWVRRHLGVA